MLQLSIAVNGSPQVAQRHEEPMVYLDHWALRMFSEDRNLAGRLQAALVARSGTVALSWINLGEFAKVADGSSTRRAEDFLEALLPHLFFIESDPFKVIEREDEVLSGIKRVLPHADQDLLAEVMKLKPSTVKPITVVGLLKGFYGSVLVGRGEALADTFVTRVIDLRERFAVDAGFREQVRAAAKSGEIPWATRFIHRELVARLLADPGKKLTRNDAFDWFHTVVPLAYCQAMLVDGHWARQAEIVTKTLADAGSKAPLAAVFSGRRGGVERFLREVEASSSAAT
jgi:hypothetical protein